MRKQQLMRNLKVLAGAMTALNLAGCAIASSPVTGFLYTDVRHPGSVTEAYGGSARGEACASSILGLVANGDASIETAKANGQIVQVTSVDHSSSNILLVYSKYCTVVYGKRGGPAAPGTPGAPATSGNSAPVP